MMTGYDLLTQKQVVLTGKDVIGMIIVLIS